MAYQIDEVLDTAPCGFLSFSDDGTIVLINATLLELLGMALNEVCGRKIECLLPIASRIFYQTHFFPLLKLHGKAEEVYFSLRSKQGESIPMLVNGTRKEKAGEFVNDCIFIPIKQRIQYEDEILKAKKTAEAAILAQQQAEKIILQQTEREILLRKTTQRIHQSLDLSCFLEIAVEEIRQHFRADRVGIFKFHPDSAYSIGEFIVESVAPGFSSALGKLVQDRHFSKRFAMAYQNGRIQATSDVDAVDLQECHRILLARFQIRANLVMPLLKAGALWGLLCVHQCSSPREWQPSEIDFSQQIANQLAIAIQQADLFEKLQKELAEREQAEARLKEINEELSQATHLLEGLVNTDGLTRIANRRCFDDRLEQEWLRLCREKKPLSILLFDVDYFKRYNDCYGHQLGDDCLIKIAQATQQVVQRPPDLMARYGGEEFVALLPDTPLKGAIAVAENIHRAIWALTIPHQDSEVSDRITISLGIATEVPTAQRSAANLVHQADQALYRAKQQGRNQSAVFMSSNPGNRAASFT
ncbi:MAG TPA: diguanylate cyclase [Leptolyngbyaceae cyanobacterium]